MNKTWLSIGLVALVVIAGFLLVRSRGGDEAQNLSSNQTSQNSEQEQTANSETGTSDNEVTQDEVTNAATDFPADNEQPPAAAKTVSMTDAGFSPKTLEVSVGETVIFKNDGTALRWPASAPHPTHTGLAGFDAQRALEPGESWSFKFTTAGTFNYHDHLNSGTTGTIVVK